MTSSLSSLKVLMNEPLVSGHNYFRLMHTSTNRAPFCLNRARPTCRYTLKCMIGNQFLSFRPILHRRTDNEDSFRRLEVHSGMPTKTVNMVSGESEENDLHEQLILLKNKLHRFGIQLGHFNPGLHNKLLCPKCLGGDSEERSFAVHIRKDGLSAVWKCFRSNCGWVGIAMSEKAINGQKLEKPKDPRKITERELSFVPLYNYAEELIKRREMEKPKYPKKIAERDLGLAALNNNGENPIEGPKLEKPKEPRKITEQELGLMPLTNYIINYFRERGISAETLERNNVMQKRALRRMVRRLSIIAFTYRRDGVLVNCKYRNLLKKFWQEPRTERILYGIDDIKDAKDVIIVEGEIDKLSMEEAGFKNCVSVPNGAPITVSNKDLPDREKDTTYQYLWTCIEYFSTVTRIILATDADRPGQALAEELARRLGKERCWRVKWPKRNDVDGNVCRDANEVLVYLGKDALREVIENAEMYPINSSFRFDDFPQEIEELHQASTISVGENFEKIKHGESAQI